MGAMLPSYFSDVAGCGCRLEDQLEQIASRHRQQEALWQGRLAALEAQLAKTAAPPPQLLAAVHDIEHRLQDLQLGMLQQSDCQAQQLER